MDRDKFQKAVEAARHAIRAVPQVVGGTPEEVIARSYQTVAAEHRQAALHDLIRLSREHASAWDGVNLIAQDHLRNGAFLPSELAAWIASRIESNPTCPRPTRKGQGPDAKFSRDLSIVLAVLWLTEAGLSPATRGGAGKASVEGGSVCDAVGVAVGLSYKRVERLWTDTTSPVRKAAELVRLSSSNPV